MKKSVENFQSSGGRHCITQAMKKIFAYYGHPLSEEMLFGLGEGLDFTYINLTHSPMVSGRSKVLEFEKVISALFISGCGQPLRRTCSCTIWL